MTIRSKPVALVFALGLAACDSSPKAPAATPDATAATAHLTPAEGAPATPPGAAEAPPPATPATPVEADAMKSFAKASNAFAFDLYARRRGAPGNLVFSPASLTTALAMTWAGGRGQTADEMKKALRVEGDQVAAVTAAGKLVARLNDPAQKVKVRAKNRLFGQKSFRFEPAYLERTRSAFGAPLEPLDFVKASGEARGRINAWAAQETEGRITELVPPAGIDRETRLVLVNAIYFLGTWQSPFKKASTYPQSFFAPGAAPAPVPTMHQAGTFGYAARDGAKALELPYAGGEFSLTLVLPDRPDGLAALEASLTAEKFDGWVGALAPTRVDLALPKFKLEPAQSLSLGDDLKALGMRLAFDRAQADFGGIANPPDPSDRLFIGAVFHKAFIKVDEEGTEAAAATAVAMPRDGGAAPPAGVEFHADHPFLFALRDRQTGMILFVGRVTTPTT